MERFIAHFDILGYKEFIENNSIEHINRYNNDIFRESQHAVARDGAYIDLPNGAVAPDIQTAEINCLHFSDTIIFWTAGASISDFQKLVHVCFKFFARSMQIGFCIRGAVGFGDFTFSPFTVQGERGAAYHNASLFGKALVDIYIKAETQNWAGCYIDNSALYAAHQGNRIVTDELICNLIYENILMYYPVPLNDTSKIYKHCFRLISGSLNNVAFRNRANTIEQVFKKHMNGKPLHPNVMTKMNNTLEFLRHHTVDNLPRL